MSTTGKHAAGGLRRLARPQSWPVRWRLTAVSAGLTLVILMLFGGAIGKIATQRISDDFNNEVVSSVQILAGETEIEYSLFEKPKPVGGPQLESFVRPDDASARFYDYSEQLIGESPNAVDMGRPRTGLHDYDGMRVATAPIFGEAQTVSGYVQYGRSLEHVNDTIARVWLLIAGGIIGGTLLAIFAGVAIAGRAMRPIAALTASAREISTTRDPSQHMPEPKVDDEVGELAETLEQMLRSLDAARAEREGAMQKQREFVADASHELRTPLTSVLANLELLQASLGRADQAEDREIVDSALRSSKRMSRLVGDLLLLARADAGRLAPHRRCDLAEVAGEAAAEAAPLMGGRAVPYRQRAPAAGRRQPRRAPPPRPQPARQRRSPHPRGRHDRAEAARGRRRRGRRSRRRRPRHPGGAADPDLRAFRARRGPRRHPSRHRHRARPGDRQRRRRLPRRLGRSDRIPCRWRPFPRPHPDGPARSLTRDRIPLKGFSDPLRPGLRFARGRDTSPPGFSPDTVPAGFFSAVFEPLASTPRDGGHRGGMSVASPGLSRVPFGCSSGWLCALWRAGIRLHIAAFGHIPGEVTGTSLPSSLLSEGGRKTRD